MKYRIRNPEVRAIRFEGFRNLHDCMNLLSESECEASVYPGGDIVVHSLHGTLRAIPGDWLLVDEDGNISMCSDETFKDKYEAM